MADTGGWRRAGGGDGAEGCGARLLVGLFGGGGEGEAQTAGAGGREGGVGGFGGGGQAGGGGSGGGGGGAQAPTCCEGAQCSVCFWGSNGDGGQIMVKLWSN